LHPSKAVRCFDDQTGSAAGPRNVQVWLAVVSERDPAGAADWLSPAERDRLEQTPNRSLRRQRLAGYALRRRALGRWLGVEPGAVPLRMARDGQVQVDTPGAAPVTVSLSHTEGLVAVALAPGGRVGIDVERVRRRRDEAATASRFFHPDEARAIRNAPPERRPALLLDMWVRKESFAKASGRDLFEVLPRRVGDQLGDPSNSDRWRIVALELPGQLSDGTLGARYAGALALELPRPQRAWAIDTMVEL
jgi:4'-phosphopantetheinyl transferase